MDKPGFAEFVKAVVRELEANAGEFSRSDAPALFERRVAEAAKKVARTGGLACAVDRVEGGHAFPDVVLTFSEGETFGIEVKSSVNPKVSNDSWTAIGNSVLGSTRIDVEDLHVVLFKVNKNGAFVKSARFEDCVSDIVVTHSPRFKLDLGLKPGCSFFDDSGIAYGTLVQSEDPIGLVTEHMKRRGLTAWWISQSSPAAVRTWEEIGKPLREELVARAFALFPELLLSTGSSKYKRLAKWLVTEHSVVDSSLRDRFSAGGRADLEAGGRIFPKMPKTLLTWRNHLPGFKRAIESASLEDLESHWEDHPSETDSVDERYARWYEMVADGADWRTSEELDFVRMSLLEIRGP